MASKWCASPRIIRNGDAAVINLKGLTRSEFNDLSEYININLIVQGCEALWLPFGLIFDCGLLLLS